MRTIFLARINSDTTEGRGVQQPFAAFEFKSDAEQAAQKNEPYGYKNQFCDIKEILIYGSFDEYKMDGDRNIQIQTALNKLTDKEKTLLFSKTGLPK